MNSLERIACNEVGASRSLTHEIARNSRRATGCVGLSARFSEARLTNSYLISICCDCPKFFILQNFIAFSLSSNRPENP